MTIGLPRYVFILSIFLFIGTVTSRPDVCLIVSYILLDELNEFENNNVRVPDDETPCNITASILHTRVARVHSSTYVHTKNDARERRERTGSREQ